MSERNKYSVESYDADESCGRGQSVLVCEQGESQPVTYVYEDTRQRLPKSPSARLSSFGAFQGPHNWRRRLRPTSVLDHCGNGSTSEQMFRSTEDMSQRDASDTLVPCDRYHHLRYPQYPVVSFQSLGFSNYLYSFVL